MEMLRAQLDGRDYPPDGVQDTPRIRALWDEIAASIADPPPGVVPEIRRTGRTDRSVFVPAEYSCSAWEI